MATRKPRTIEEKLHDELGITAEDIETWGPRWERVAWVDRAYWIVQRRHRNPAASKLLRVENVVRDLWRRLAAGEGIDDRLDVLFRAATGRSEDSNAQLELMLGISTAARIKNTVSDAGLVKLAMIDFEKRYPHHVCRLRRHSNHAELIATAVRAWRRKRGRPRKGELVGSKWTFTRHVLAAAGLDDDETSLEARWTERTKK